MNRLSPAPGVRSTRPLPGRVIRRSRSFAPFALAGAAAGCGLLGSGGGARTVSPDGVAVEPRSGDVWSTRVHIEVSVVGEKDEGTACEAVRDDTSALRYAAVSLAPARSSRGLLRSFSGDLAVGPGYNAWTIACTTGVHVATGRATFRGRVRDVPRLVLTSRAGEDALVFDATGSEPSPVSGSPFEHVEWSLETAGSHVAIADTRNPTLEVPAGKYPTRTLLVRAKGFAFSGDVDQASALVDVSDGRHAVLRTDSPFRSEPERVGIVYGVIPSRYGIPALPAATHALEALAALGVSTVWLAPAMKTLPGDYGYAVADPFEVREDWGTSADLRRFVDEAHARHLRVLFDLVTNHLSVSSPLFQEAARDGARSTAFRFFDRDAAGAPTHYFGWTTLANLDVRNPDVLRFQVEVARHALESFDVDGFRVDAAWAVERRDPGFWDRWIREVRRMKPDALLVAEAPSEDGRYLGHGFDAVYDWSDVGRPAWESAFDDPDQTAQRLDAALGPVPASNVLRFLENNDTGARFLTRHGVRTTRLATTLLLTLPGIPALFSGEEHGAEYDPYGPLTHLPVGDRHRLAPFVKRLARARAESPSLRRGAFTRLETPASPAVFAFARTSRSAAGAAGAAGAGADVEDDSAVVLLNFGSKPARVHLDELPPAKNGFAELFTGRYVPGKGPLDVALDPGEAWVLVRAKP